MGYDSLFGKEVQIMKKTIIPMLLLVFVTACGAVGPTSGPVVAGETPMPTPATTAASSAVATGGSSNPSAPTETASAATAEPSSAPSPTTPPEVAYGPTNFPAGIDPLTGLQVANPALLNRRPMAIKISNLPRDIRPQFGLSLADQVFEYYTEEGTTRFIALFYGNDASRVGPIRSGRFFDGYIIQGYKAVFAFGFAYVAEMNRFLNSDYANRLVIESPGSPLTRYDPNGANSLVVNTADLSAYATQQGMGNNRQNLDGMTFKSGAPAGGQPVSQLFVRYSAAIYNRWDYDTATGKYLRFSDTADDLTGGQDERYAQLTDALTKEPVAFDNLAVLYVTHQLYAPNIYDILFVGSGAGYVFRDGQAYPVKWQRGSKDVVSLTNPDGSPFALKPGTTWFEVIGAGSTVNKSAQYWRFTHLMP